MAFVMTKKKREYVHPYQDGTSITHRAFTPEERAKFETELAKIRGTKGFQAKFDVLIKQVAKVLLVDWKVFQEGDEGLEAFPFTPENVDSFLDDIETKAYWYRPIAEYLYPSKVEDSILPEGEDPNFS